MERDGGVIILASSSPRRRALLKKAGISFRVLRPAYKETNIGGASVLKLTKRHALGKAMSVMARVREGVILAADTGALSGGRVLGKPRTMKAAERMLGSLQGRTHTVVTAVALIRMRAGRPAKRSVFAEKSSVRLKKMTPLQIKTYLRKIGPLDKTGAYAAQAAGSGVVERVKGSFSNVVGLPMEKLLEILKLM